MSETCTLYVEKARYDTLVRKYMCAKRELYELTKAWNEMREKMNDIDDRILEDIHKYRDVQLMQSYIDGVVNTLVALNWDVQEMEEKRYVSPDRKQNPV